MTPTSPSEDALARACKALAQSLAAEVSMAVLTDNVEGLASALKRGAVVAGDHVLKLAAGRAHPQTIALLLNHGADPLMQDGIPLVWAAEAGGADAVALLLSRASFPPSALQRAREKATEFDRAEVLQVLDVYERERHLIANLEARPASYHLSPLKTVIFT